METEQQGKRLVVGFALHLCLAQVSRLLRVHVCMFDACIGSRLDKASYTAVTDSIRKLHLVCKGSLCSEALA